jgi:hypothetical protein
MFTLLLWKGALIRGIRGIRGTTPAKWRQHLL